MDKLKSGSKAAFDKGWGYFEKLGAPVNKLTNKIGSEAFWPTTLDKECDKAARILKSFCKDGFYTEVNKNDKKAMAEAEVEGPKEKPKVLVKIPQKVIQNCVGLAIFTTMRTGLHISGAGGSGVLVARKPDGTWSPPSGILVHTLGVGFMIGIDIYDCVVVINKREALEAFTRVRVTIGGEISAVAGPIGAGGMVDTEVHKRVAALYTYMKSRGFYAGVQADGTVVVERNDENARFYGEKLTCLQILAGDVKNIPESTRVLLEVCKAADGQDFSAGVMEGLQGQPTPADLNIQEPSRPPTDQEQNMYGYYGGDKTENTTYLPLPRQQTGVVESGYSPNTNVYPPPPSGAPPPYYPPPPGPPPSQHPRKE